MRLETTLSLEDFRKLSNDVLLANGFSEDQAAAITEVVYAAQRDDCQSHGAYRLLGYVRSVREGAADPKAVPEVVDHAPGIVRVNANFGFCPLAIARGLPLLVQKARHSGLAALAINNCFDLSALWSEVEAIGAQGLAALSMNVTHAGVAPAGGKKPLFGTNPIAFAWPRPDGAPFVFDFATSVVARGEIELHGRAGKPIPQDWAIDAEGRPTTDAAAALAGAMLTFGGHKGSALATMIELMAGPLIGDKTSAESAAFDRGRDAAPCHGKLLLAFDPQVFLGAEAAEHLARAETVFEAIVGQGARLPSQRRYAARARSRTEGVRIPVALYEDLQNLLTR